MYAVHSGPTLSRRAEFELFDDALSLHRLQLQRGANSKLINESGYEPSDGDGSKECLGLTKFELAQLEAVESL